MMRRLTNRCRYQRKGECAPFTVLELLAVVAIIAVLAAMLLPAMQRARYSAKLVLCVNNLKDIGITTVTYTGDFDGYYPYRQTVPHETLGAGWAGTRPNYIRHRPGVGVSADDRPAMRDYYDLNLLFDDPLCPGNSPSLEVDDPDGVNPWQWGSFKAADYDLWFGWKYTTENRGVYRVGDPLTWNGEEYHVLATDYSSFIAWNFWVLSNHPDSLSILRKGQWEGSSNYQAPGADARGKLDMNALYDDGSVKQIPGVVVKDPRMAQVPYCPWPSAFASYPLDYRLVPKD